MSIEITCEQCQKRYRVKPELAGKRVRCVQCGFAVLVPGGQGENHDDNISDLSGDHGKFAHEPPRGAPPPAHRPAPPRVAPPPVPKQVVRHDPRFDPQAITDYPAAPQAPGTPPPARPAPPRKVQPAANELENQPERELQFADEDPLFISKPKPRAQDNMDDTAAAPAISEDEKPEPRLDQEPMIPRGRSGHSSRSKMADTAVAPAPEPEFPEPSDRPVFATPAGDPMARFRAEQAAGINHKCSGCGAPMKIGSIICLNCGFNIATGERGGGAAENFEDAPTPSRFGRWLGRAEWRAEDRNARTLAILGVLIALLPLLAWQWKVLAKPGQYISLAGLGLAILAAGLFAMRQRFTRAGITAVIALLAYAGYLNFRPIYLDELVPTIADSSKSDAPRPAVKPANDGGTAPKPNTSDPATTEVMAILRGPAEGIDPINWHVTYLVHADPRVRFKSANYLVESTPAGRKEEVSRAFEGRLTDEHPQMRRLAIAGVALYIDDRTIGVLTPLLKDEEEAVRVDAYKLLAKLKDPRALPAIVSRLSEDGTLARDALAAFDAAHATAITRAFEQSLRDANPRQRELAARELANYAGPNTPAALLALLEDNDATVRNAALVTLGKLKDPRTLDAIIARLAYDRTATIAALEQFGPAAEKAVLSMLKSSQIDVRLAAAEVLKTVGTRESIPALYETALDHDLRLVTAAKDAWRKIAPDDFTAGLEFAVDIESGHNTRMRAAVERLAEARPDKHQERAVKMLVKAAMDSDLIIREGAHKALPIWGTPDTAPALLEFLTDKTNPTRRQMAEAALGALKDPRGAAAVARFVTIDLPSAMDALHEMGPVAEDVVIELLSHERPDIRRAAVRILKTWGSRNKAIPALTTAIQRDRANIEADAREAINAIRERPVVVNRKPPTQPVR